MYSNDFANRGGVPMKFFKNIKVRWNDYLKKMAEANDRTFGDQRLDCCSLNRKSAEKDPTGDIIKKYNRS